MTINQLLDKLTTEFEISSLPPTHSLQDLKYKLLLLKSFEGGNFIVSSEYIAAFDAILNDPKNKSLRITS
jgi:hypothetical protein